MGSEHAEYAAREACEKATVALAAETPYEEIGELVQHLRQSGQLTAGMILRALLSGNVVLFEEALAELSGLPLDRVTSYIHDKQYFRLPRALRARPGCPTPPIRRSARRSQAMREGVLIGEQGGVARLKRRMVERVLDACAAEREPDMASLLALLRRFAVEAAREEARMFCDDLVANDIVMPLTDDFGDMRLVAAKRGCVMPGLDAGHACQLIPARSTRPLICSSTSGRSRFSWMRNSSVTSRSRLVSVAASSLASERAYSR